MDLGQRLWNDIVKEQSYYELSDEHKELLDIRLEKLEKGNCELKTWKEIKQKYE